MVSFLREGGITMRSNKSSQIVSEPLTFQYGFRTLNWISLRPLSLAEFSDFRALDLGLHVHLQQSWCCWHGWYCDMVNEGLYFLLEFLFTSFLSWGTWEGICCIQEFPWNVVCLVLNLGRNLRTRGGRLSKCLVLSNGTNGLWSVSTSNGCICWISRMPRLLRRLSAHTSSSCRRVTLTHMPLASNSDHQGVVTATLLPIQRTRHLQTPLYLRLGCTVPIMSALSAPVWSQRMTSLDQDTSLATRQLPQQLADVGNSMRKLAKLVH